MREYRIGRLNGQYVVTWTDAGKRRRFRLAARDAKVAEREALDVIRRETHAPGGHTIADIWEAYRDAKRGRRVAEAMRLEWKAIGPTFGHLRPDQITIDHSRDHSARRALDGIKPGTIWTELGHLRTALRWAYANGLIDRAPYIERPPKPAPKERYLTRAEIRRLLAVDMPLHLRVAIQLMLGTGARPTAAQELTWSRVDFDRRQIDLRADAEGPRKGRAVVAMNASLAATLREARQVALSEYVVEWNGKPVRSIKTALARAVKAAGLEGVTPHVFRHTAGVHLAEGGVPMQKIAQILGHSSTAVTERVYARYSPDNMRDEVAILDFTGLDDAEKWFSEPARSPQKPPKS